MTRSLLAAFAATLLLSASALAAGSSVPAGPTEPTASATTRQTPPIAPSAAMPSGPNKQLVAECGSLATQWTTVATEHASDKKFSKASGEASKGETSCTSHKAAMLRSGVRHYKIAFKLLHLTPTT